MCLLCGDDFCDLCRHPLEDWVQKEGGTICGMCQLFILLNFSGLRRP
ncbi:hypothetical protein Ssi03_13090 [Sphaerisporangium siamense]|uniref:Uncharacterized Zn finger protein (UPF0148 family) n=1 Tax=Sphaerisporangium siamense TaxID=795645 RepID=A0A7W7GB05_9ACTN|nr:uncharacterized Zn finger protein (UPF0148 family) [Sphaerisporangium siamense]GII83319.1 hypothetical protein Ssi03_13090 [Sphaerisporangium siamense]